MLPLTSEKILSAIILFLAALLSGLLPSLLTSCCFCQSPRRRDIGRRSREKSTTSSFKLVELFAGTSLLTLLITHLIPDAMDQIQGQLAIDDHIVPGLILLSGMLLMIWMSALGAVLKVWLVKPIAGPKHLIEIEKKTLRRHQMKCSEGQQDGTKEVEGLPLFLGDNVTSDDEDDDFLTVFDDRNSLLSNSDVWCSSVTLLSSISVHAFIEGVSLSGLGGGRGFWMCTGLIALHKVIIATSLHAMLTKVKGIQVYSILALVTCFALMTPLGLIFGSGFHASQDVITKSVSATIAGAVAIGSLLYVAIFELLGSRANLSATTCSKLCQTLAMTMGIGFVAGGHFFLHNKH